MLPLVALHGLASTSDEWDEFARSLPPAWEFIAFDQLAHGSAAEMTGDLSREAHVAHVVSQIRRHAATPCVLVGQSMGAHTAMLVAAHHPQLVSALVLIEGGVGGEGPEATTDVIAWVRTLVDDQGEPRFDAVALARAIQAVHAQQFWEDWEQVSCPTLIVRAQHSFIANEEHERMAGRPGTRVALVAESGHDIHLTRPEPLARIVIDFLREAIAA